MQTYEELPRQDVRAADRGRQRLGETWNQLLRRRPDQLLAGCLFAIFLLVYLIGRAQYLTNWDSGNFALALRRFDLWQHRPQPPGYVGYVFLGRALFSLTGDGNTALTIISAFSGAAASALMYLFLREFVDRTSALAGAVMFATAGLVVYYSSIALSYVAGGAVALAGAWLCHRARTEVRPRAFYAAAAVMALLGAIRQTDMVLLMPLLLWAARPFRWRVRWRAVALLALLCALWAVPLLHLAGGPRMYMAQSRTAFHAVGWSTHLGGGPEVNVTGLARNARMMIVGLTLGMGVGPLVLGLAAVRRVNPLALLRRSDRVFLALWGLPALLLFVLLHTGQFGYVLLMLPVLYVPIAAALAGVRRARAQRVASTPPARRRLAVSGAVLAALVAGNLVGNAWFSRSVYALMATNYYPLVHNIHQVLLEDPPTREYDLAGSDSFWDAIHGFVRQYDPQRTVVITHPGLRGTYRFFSASLPQYQQYAVWVDDQYVGWLFSAYQGKADYGIPWPNIRQVLVLPPNVDQVVFSDPFVLVLAELEDDVPHERYDLGNGAGAVVVHVTPGSTIYFQARTAERRPSIGVVHRPSPLQARLLDEMEERRRSR